MDGFKVRLQERRKTLNFSQTDIANRLGVSSQAVNQWEKGITVPRGHRLTDLASYLNTTSEWLLFGNSHHNSDSIDASAEASSLFDKESKLDSSALGSASTHSFIDIPVYDISLAAGDGYVSELEQMIETYPISTLLLSKHNLHSSDAIVSKVRGASMEPTLNNEDMVLINTSVKKPISNKIFAFSFEDSLRVKRFNFRLDRNWLISSDNDDKSRYRDEVLSPQNASKLKIIGQVVTIVERSLL